MNPLVFAGLGTAGVAGFAWAVATVAAVGLPSFGGAPAPEATPKVSAAAVTKVAKKVADKNASQAKSWNLTGQVKARFDAKVVDVLCEVSGGAACAANCGGGAMQLGVVRLSDNKLFPVAKNGQTVFSGAVADLLPYCQKEVEVDGLLAGEGDIKVYQVQLIREKGVEKWTKARGFTNDWKTKFPAAGKAKGPWFRNDPRVKAHIAKDGWLGLGKDADVAYAKDEL